ncbi:hypothetical protein DPMN_035883 [Dreissena polymorpha]|uniref:Uncharacterized protein n=1 Tax=Dreissena polymorpha TaxID=45954 RepID=A0A9D4M9N9_DREPO|nr:hypothetical protein DPMN_035883 [Dreissena polymorpha]
MYQLNLWASTFTKRKHCFYLKLNPIIPQTTLASDKVKFSAHIGSQIPEMFTSTWPSCVAEPVANCTFVSK